MIILYFAKFTRYKYDNYRNCFPLRRRRGFTATKPIAYRNKHVSAKLSLAFISTQLGYAAIAATLAEQQPKPTITSEPLALMAAIITAEYSLHVTYLKCRFKQCRSEPGRTAFISSSGNRSCRCFGYGRRPSNRTACSPRRRHRWCHQDQRRSLHMRRVRCPGT